MQQTTFYRTVKLENKWITSKQELENKKEQKNLIWTKVNKHMKN